MRGPGAGHWARAAGPPLGLSLGVLRDAAFGGSYITRILNLILWLDSHVNHEPVTIVNCPCLNPGEPLVAPTAG